MKRICLCLAESTRAALTPELARMALLAADDSMAMVTAVALALALGMRRVERRVPG